MRAVRSRLLDLGDHLEMLDLRVAKTSSSS